MNVENKNGISVGIVLSHSNNAPRYKVLVRLTYIGLTLYMGLLKQFDYTVVTLVRDSCMKGQLRVLVITGLDW